MLLFILLIACALSALFILKRSALVRDHQLQWPPGPPVWPIIGHLHLLGPLPHQSLCDLSKLYGPLMGLRLGRVPTIIASSPHMAKAILQTHDLAFAFPLASELFSSKRLESSRHVREEEVRELLRSLLQMANKKPYTPIEIRASLLATSNNINCRMAIGGRMKEISRVTGLKRDLLSLVEEVMHLLGVFNVGDFIPWLAWLDPQGNVKRMKAAGQRAKEVMQAMIDERREAHKARQLGHSPNDLLDVMLLAASDQDTQLDNKTLITDDNIKGLLMDILIGGLDTSTTTIEWALAELINNPQAMQKAQQELDRVVGTARLVQEVDIPSLPYLGAVFKKSMRLHPTAPLLIPHASTQECQIDGRYKIPSKARAYVNTWAIGRDPTIWERPTDFWPERPQNNNLDLRGQNFEFLPFGSGRRRCPGLALGLLNTHLTLASLVQGFRWSIVSSDVSKFNSHTHLLDMSERFETALVMAKPLCAFATPRLALHLY